jgi:hypothetical protein
MGKETTSAFGAHIGQGAWSGVAKPGFGIGSCVADGQGLQDARFADAVADGCFGDEVRSKEECDQHDKADCKFKEQGAGKRGFEGGLPSLDVHKSPHFKRSNLDATGLRVVRKGCVVEFPHTGQRETVVRVRMGSFWVPGFSSPAFTPCSRVQVVE